MKTKDYAVEVVEKQADAIKELLLNNVITQSQAADMLSKIQNIGLITNMDFDDITNEWVMEIRYSINRG
jgi:phage-related minor tail protein